MGGGRMLRSACRPYVFVALAGCFLASGHAQAAPVTLDVDVTIDQLGAGAPPGYVPGTVDHLRITYEEDEVDAATHCVRLRSLSHFMGDHWADVTPVDASSLDLSGQPYRLNFASSVVHGSPIVIAFEALTLRMAILARPDFHLVIAGSYVIHAPAAAIH
jgi:hypothetical protein